MAEVDNKFNSCISQINHSMPYCSLICPLPLPTKHYTKSLEISVSGPLYISY